MFKTIYGVSIIAVLFLCFSYSADAQIAPTNTATISGSVSDDTGKPVGGAQVSLSGPKNTSMQTDTHGLFIFVGVPFGTYQVSSAAVGLGTATRSISVTGDTNIAIQYELAAQNGLKVIARVASVANAQFNVTPASITQVNTMEQAFQGQTSWRTILEQIPGLAQAGLGNGNSFALGVPSGPLMPVQFSIDGSLPYETATLLDDMPLIGGNTLNVCSGGGGAGTNLALYPLNGFASADVVRGPGANAPTILDSIGGSLVLHAPGMVAHNQYTFSVSTDPYGGIVANGQGLVRLNKLSVSLTYGVNDSPGPINRARIPLNPGKPLTVDGVVFSPYAPPCSSPCTFGHFLISPNYSGGFAGLYGFQTGLAQCCTNESTAWSVHSGSLALTYALSPWLSAKIFYAGQQVSTGVPTPDEVLNFVPPTGYTGNLQGGQYFANASNAGFSPNNFTQASSLLEESITAQLGRGTLRLAALQNRDFTAQTFVVAPASGVVQLYGGGHLNGSSTVTAFNGGTYNVTYAPRSGFSFNGTYNRDLLLSFTTPLGEDFHAGTSFVKSYYDNPCFLLETGFTSTIPSATSATNNELRFFIGGNPSLKTSVDLSAYFINVNYHVQNPDVTGGWTDIHSTYAAPRLGFVWHPNASTAIRAAAGGGFAEAPLNALAGGSATPSFDPTNLIYTVSPLNLNLQPEKSFAFDLGTDIRLQRSTILSLDVYRANLYGQLYTSTMLANPAYNGSSGVFPLYTTLYGNLSHSRYEGILLDISHDVPKGVYWSLSGGLTRGYLVSVPAGFYDDPTQPCTNCTNLTVVPNVNFNGTFAGAIPYAQALGTIGYRWSPQKYVDLTGTYYGNNNTYYRPAFAEFNGHISYPMRKNASLLLTFNNITGIYDAPLTYVSPATLTGAPTISGLPSALFGQQYGPRTIILTLSTHS